MLDAQPLLIERQVSHCIYSRFWGRRWRLHVGHLGWNMGVFVADMLGREIRFSWVRAKDSSPAAGLPATQIDNRIEHRG